MKAISPLSIALWSAAVLATSTALSAPPRLLPFQGRLTDANGAPVADGAKVVQFKIYNAPTGGTAVWAGEVQKLTVNGGLVSTLLGSKASMDTVDFNQALYLEITVDANADGQITVADPPLLPRQSVMPAVFAVEAHNARDSVKLAGFDWSAVFVDGGGQPTNNPTGGKIPVGRVNIPTGGITASMIAATNGLSADQIAPNAVDTSELKDNSVVSAKIKDGEVFTADLSGEINGAGVETTIGAVTSAKIQDGTIRTADLGDGVVTAIKSSPDMAVFYEQTDSNVSNPASSAGWQVRKITGGDIIPGTGGSITRTGNTITLQPGSYYVQAAGVGYGVRQHQLILRDVTNSAAGDPTDVTAVIRGLTSYSNVAPNAHATTTSQLSGLLTVQTTPKSYELWHYVVNAQGTSGFGTATGLGGGPSTSVSNRWSQISIIRVK